MATGGNSITTIENNGDFSRSLWHLRIQLINQSLAQTSSAPWIKAAELRPSLTTENPTDFLKTL